MVFSGLRRRLNAEWLAYRSHRVIAAADRLTREAACPHAGGSGSLCGVCSFTGCIGVPMTTRKADDYDGWPESR